MANQYFNAVSSLYIKFIFMEIIQFIISAKNYYMKKAQTVLTILLLASAIFTKIQAQKIPPPPPSSENLENSHQPQQVTDFLKRNQTVANIHWKSNNKIILALKNGKTKTYDLSKQEIRTDFINKYGIPPTPPPPPPPAPPSPPLPPSQKRIN